MDIDKAEDMFYKTRDSLGLSECTFKWSWIKRFNGVFYPSKLIIRLSKSNVVENSKEQVHQTILHELAHLIDYKKRGRVIHDDLFKQICSDIGCYEIGSERQYRAPAMRYLIACKCCGRIVGHRERLNRELKQDMKCEIYCRNNLFDAPLLRRAIIVKNDENCQLDPAISKEYKNQVHY